MFPASLYLDDVASGSLQMVGYRLRCAIGIPRERELH